MKKIIAILTVTAALLMVGLWPSSADAASGLQLSYSFVGCSGTQATYDLSASYPNGGTFTWSQGANPISSATDNPNYADTSFIKIGQLIWVQVVNKMASEQVSVNLPNPCIYP